MKRWLSHTGRVTWTTCSVLVLLVTLYAYDGTPRSDAEILLIYGMLVLAFPAGFLASLLMVGVLVLIEAIVGRATQTSYASIVLEWICLTAAGYFQWFKLVPWLYRKAQLKLAARGKDTRTNFPS